MRKERLQVLKKVANGLQLLNSGDDKDFIKRVVFPIEKTKSGSELRTKLRELMRKVLAKNNSTEKKTKDNTEPLFTADEMVLQILPSGESWQETKDILLIALYEKLSFDEEIEKELENLTQGEEDE